MAVAFLLGRAEFFSTVERKSYDWRCANIERTAPKPTSSLVLVDEATLAFFRETDGLRWPCPRDLYCPVLSYLKAGGARAVAFDIQFSEPDEFDGAFAECMADAGNVVLGFQCHADTQATNLPLPGTVAVAGQWPSKPCQPLPPMPSLRAAAKALGAIEMEPDDDGVLRHATLLRPYRGAATPSLGVSAWLAANDVKTAEFSGDELKLADRRIPLTQQGQMLV